MISILTGALGILVAALIVLLIRKDRLHVAHGFGWIIVAVLFSLLGFAPDIIDITAGHLGVGYPPSLALTIAIVILVIKILLMDIEHSRLEIRNQRMIQRVALLENSLREAVAQQNGEHKEIPAR